MAKSVNPAQVRANEVAKNVFGNLNQLHIEATKWETEFYNPTMAKLYGLLSKALAEVLILRGEGSKAVKAFTEVLKQKKITCTARTSLELRVVRVVFGISDTTQRANRYATVLKVACERNVSPESFAEWVVEEGGIDELRRSMTKKPQPDYEKLAADFYEAVPAMADIELSGASFSQFDDSEFRLLVVRKNSDSSFSAVSEVNSLSHIKSALAFLGKQLSEATKAGAKQADDDERLEKSIIAASQADVQTKKAA
jgi:hypothetical protein